MEFNIATAPSRVSKQWKNETISWDTLLVRIQNPTRTPETTKEYASMSASEKGKIKDVGGFVGGHLRDGRRVKGAVAYRQLITLDADSPGKDFLQDVDLVLDGQAYLIYSTHSHTKQAPRYRLIIPTARKMDPDEYQAVSRRLANSIGLHHFDDTTYAPERLMYWPSVSRDGEYVCLRGEGAFTNPDIVLATYDNWRDPTTWPCSERVLSQRQHALDRQEDPLSKQGLVGDFCRAYSITEAVERFLPDIYEACNAPNFVHCAPTSSPVPVLI